MTSGGRSVGIVRSRTKVTELIVNLFIACWKSTDVSEARVASIWRRKRHFPPKRRWTFKGLHSVKSQKTELFSSVHTYRHWNVEFTGLILILIRILILILTDVQRDKILDFCICHFPLVVVVRVRWGQNTVRSLQVGFVVHPASYPMGTSSGLKWQRLRADHSPPSSGEIKNRGAILPSPIPLQRHGVCRAGV
jgi:hypothetical protein